MVSDKSSDCPENASKSVEIRGDYFPDLLKSDVFSRRVSVLSPREGVILYFLSS